MVLYSDESNVSRHTLQYVLREKNGIWSGQLLQSWVNTPVEVTLKKEKTKLYRLLQRVPSSSGTLPPISPKQTRPPPHIASRILPSSTEPSSISTSEGPDDGLEDDQVENLKLNFKLNMEVDETLDVPSTPFDIDGVHSIHGFALKSPLGVSGHGKFSGISSGFSDSLLIDGIDSGSGPSGSPLHPPFDVFDVPGTSTTFSGRGQLSPTSARLDSPPISLTAHQLPSPLRSPFRQVTSSTTDSSVQMTF